jgi:hypothetical protein
MVVGLVYPRGARVVIHKWSCLPPSIHSHLISSAWFCSFRSIILNPPKSLGCMSMAPGSSRPKISPLLLAIRIFG